MMKGVSAKLMEGPCYLKLLVNNVTAGSLIGRTGSTLEALQAHSGTSIRVFPSDVHFPGTNERIVILGGSQEKIEVAISLILEKIEEVTSSASPNTVQTGTPPRVVMRMALPRSAVAAVIGKGGQQIRQLQEISKASIQISNREDAISERIVTISGTADAVRVASTDVMSIIQSDTTLKDYLAISYRSPTTPAIGVPPAMSHLHMGGNKMNMYHSTVNNQSPTSSAFAETLLHHCEIFIHIPDECVGAVIGKGGAFLVETMNISGARVRISQKGELIPGTSDRKCRITGSVGNVHAAHIILLQRLEQAQASLNNNSFKSNNYNTSTHGEHKRKTSHQNAVSQQQATNGATYSPSTVDVNPNASSNVNGNQENAAEIAQTYVSSNGAAARSTAELPVNAVAPSNDDSVRLRDD